MTNTGYSANPVFNKWSRIKIISKDDVLETLKLKIQLHDISGCPLEYVTFKFDPDYGYSWRAERRNSPHLALPTKGQMVIFWKTIEGAKRNFLKRYERTI